ncbi:DUF4864 domain-containing protein [Candidatus Manganitrophus noduliformans]|uniref:DUF4864 domain-containing protein n=1 Tax=Candidatus Manganitrophus noduliformans TaxID=2606439 RepID=A0A7X6DU03_9BACT|nr:DUF4864 domain-containing protein [Candidatus Manganitrophus noduliformans]NKE73319.1 DUF4864 domain-containing protein [Candidatus Manganitrophus noduliformans]
MIPSLILWFTLFTLRPSTRPIQAPDPSPEAQEIASVIRQQLDAFTFNNYEEAYRLVSKKTKDRLSLDQYAQMVRAEYPEITKSLSVSLGEIRFAPDPTHATARVEITGFNHKKVTAEYQMIREEEGWRVDGITITTLRARGPIGWG